MLSRAATSKLNKTMEVKYDRTGIDYNLTRKADKNLTEQLLCFLQPIKNEKHFDIGCGKGNYSNELQKNGFDFIRLTHLN